MIVRKWAERLWVWVADGVGLGGADGWSISHHEDIGRYVIYSPARELVSGWPAAAEIFVVPSTTAKVWLLALESGATVTRMCPDCAGGRRPYSFDPDASVRVLNERLREALAPNGDGLVSCPTCDATGRITVEAARLVCEAAPRTVEFCQDCDTPLLHAEGIGPYCPREGCIRVDDARVVRRVALPGCPTARTELLAVAYGLDPGASDEQRVGRIGGPYTRDSNAEFIARWTNGSRVVDTDEGKIVVRSEPDEALVLRDYLADRGLGPADLSLDVLAEFGTPPETEFGRVLLAWLGEAPCGDCGGSGQWKPKAPGWAVMGRLDCPACTGKGTGSAALLKQLPSTLEVLDEIAAVGNGTGPGE